MKSFLKKVAFFIIAQLIKSIQPEGRRIIFLIGKKHLLRLQYINDLS